MSTRQILTDEEVANIITIIRNDSADMNISGLTKSEIVKGAIDKVAPGKLKFNSSTVSRYWGKAFHEKTKKAPKAARIKKETVKPTLALKSIYQANYCPHCGCPQKPVQAGIEVANKL